MFSKTRTIFFGQVLAVCGESMNSLKATMGGGCAIFDGFHSTDGDRQSYSLSCSQFRFAEKRRFIEIGSQTEGGIFKKSDMSNTDRRIGVNAAVLLGFRYDKGR